MKITPQDTYDNFIGSGALSYPWYQDVVDQRVDDQGNVDAGWQVSFTEHNDDGPVTQRVITHSALLAAVRKLAGKEGAEILGYEDSIARRECQALISKGPDYCDFDADAADIVIQVATLGRVIYG